MIHFEPVDALEVQILVDNATDSLSSVPSHVETEFALLRRKGMSLLSGRCLCCAAHGLSCLITARRGDTSRTVLFDSGPDPDVIARNTQMLSIDLGVVDSIVLSHGHWDHAGGMLRAIDMVRSARPEKELPYFAHPGVFRSRARQLPNGGMLPMEDVPSIRMLNDHGAQFVGVTEPSCIVDGYFALSGEIPRVTSFEQGLAFHYAKTEEGWEPDPWIKDEQWLAVNIVGKGLVLFTACSHAGVINVLEHARTIFPSVPLHCVVGGLHLSGPNEGLIESTITALRRFSIDHIAAGHCTGWRALAQLTLAFGDKVVTPTAVGKHFVF